MATTDPHGWVVVHLDALLRDRGMTATELAERIGITQANVSILKTGKAKAIRFTTLIAICHALDCQPGDLLSYETYETASVQDGTARTGAAGITLLAAGPRPIAVVKELRELGGLGLRQAKDLVDETPSLVLTGLTLEASSVALAKLRKAGATVERH